MDMNHVLIVEDDTEIREGVTIYLKSQGYEVFQASDGIEGLEILQKEEIHLAIIDIMMPRMDGIRMTMKLREKYYFPVKITDRFVRGDASRNTEGSGLGLAMAKSFVELQHGNLRISAEADLFKAEITLPKTDPSSLSTNTSG